MSASPAGNGPGATIITQGGAALRSPGRAAVRVYVERTVCDVDQGCNEGVPDESGAPIDLSEPGLSYSWEYGPTTAYGLRTAPRPVDTAGSLPAILAPLGYERLYHFRLVISGPNWTRLGVDNTVRVPHTALRPRARIRYEFQRSGRTLRVKRIAVFDAVGSYVTIVYCSSVSFGCDPIGATRRARSAELTHALDIYLEPRDELAVELSDRPRIVGPPSDYYTSNPAYEADLIARPRPTILTRCGRGVLIPSTIPGSLDPCLNILLLTSGPRITHLSIDSAPLGLRVAVLCHGPGCPRRRTITRVRGGSDAPPLRSVALPGFRRLRAGATLDIVLTRPGSLGISRRLRITRTGVVRGPLRCIALGSARRLTACR